MNYNKSPRPENRWKVLIFMLACLLLAGGIIYMKRSTSGKKALQNAAAPAAGRPVAVPDTSAAPGTVPAETDSVVPSVLPDTLLGRDTRQPYEAGVEDGYSAGCDDGAAEQERASYDETSNFRTPADRAAYARGYREGYAKGYEDGQQGKQFNI